MGKSNKLFVLCATATVVLTGCGSLTADSDSKSEDVGYHISRDVEKNEATWALATDPYHGNESIELTTHAEELITSDCMKKRGLDLPVRMDLSAPRSESQPSNNGTTVFSIDLAQKYGYHYAPNPQDKLEQAITEAGGDLYKSKDENFHKNWNECVDIARKKVSPGTKPGAEKSLDELDDESNTIGSQLNRLHVDYASTPSLVQSGKQWRECMAPLGIAGLPEYPWDPGNRPPDQILSLLPGFESQVGKPSAEEIRIATRDAKCRDSSKWTHNLYEAEWDLHKKFVDQHKSDLEPILVSYEKQGNRALAVIKQMQGGAQ
ncbi:MAG: hypothetical protein Q4A71_04895 [Actinomycetaceae bacterium]|nr:hypothetical protein [Actinomycetaceae bacterium]